MNRMSIGFAACLVAAATAGCGTAAVSQPAAGGTRAAASAAPATAPATAAGQSRAPGAVGARPGCTRPADGTLTLASNGKTYCVRVGERLEVHLRGTVARPWLEPLASSDVLRGVPYGAFSLVAGLTGVSYAASRPGRVLITSIRRPCSALGMNRNKAEPRVPLPRVYPFMSCPQPDRFIVTIVVVR